MIKNIIFDLGNVIINYDQQAIIDKFAKTNEEKEYLMRDNFKAPEWKRIDLGEINNDEAVEIINKRHNNKFAELTDEFWHNWFKVQKINEDIVDIAKTLKQKGYNIYVLSNMANATYDFFKGHDFFKLCNGIIISAQEHIKKPDERIFNILLDRYNYSMYKFNISRLFEVDNSAINTPLKGQKGCRIWHTCQVTNGKKYKNCCGK